MAWLVRVAARMRDGLPRARGSTLSLTRYNAPLRFCVVLVYDTAPYRLMSSGTRTSAVHSRTLRDKTHSCLHVSGLTRHRLCRAS